MLMTFKQVKEKYNVSRATLLKWEKEGILQPVKTPKGTRRYLQKDIEKAFNLSPQQLDEPLNETVLYARVSTKKQAAYLKNQEDRLKAYADSLNVSYFLISEIASGVNENRRGLKKLLNLVKNGNVKKVIVEYPDRLARFGFEYLKFILDTFGVELVILQGKHVSEDIQQELAEDLISIVTSFAARVYGKRGGSRKSI
jgi:putative resolvase